MNLRRIIDEIKVPALSAAIALSIGGLSPYLTRDGMEKFSALDQPPLSPPSWLFPIVWTILYILMGVSSARIYQSAAPLESRRRALVIYGAQLLLNFSWSILFFGAHLFYAAFIWLLALIAMIIAMILAFHKIDPIAAKLQIPYLIWVLFAAYLNLGVAIQNS